MSAAAGQRQLLTKPQMLAAIGNPAYSTVWKWMRVEKFPLPIELGPSGSRSSSIAWFADEVHDWIARRPRRQIGKQQHEFRGRGALAASEPVVPPVPTEKRVQKAVQMEAAESAQSRSASRR